VRGVAVGFWRQPWKVLESVGAGDRVVAMIEVLKE